MPPNRTSRPTTMITVNAAKGRRSAPATRATPYSGGNPTTALTATMPNPLPGRFAKASAAFDAALFLTHLMFSAPLPTR